MQDLRQLCELIGNCGYTVTLSPMPDGKTRIVATGDDQVWRVETDDPMAGALELAGQIGLEDLD